MEIKEKQKKKIFFFFKNKNNLLSKKLTTKRIKYDIFVDNSLAFYTIHDKIKNILIFDGYHPSGFIQRGGNIYDYINVSNIKKISNGAFHTLILTKDNKLYTFGLNNHGQCGIDYKKYYIIEDPTEIEFSHQTYKNKIKDIFCTFNTSYVLLENNELYFFGKIKNNDNNYYIPQKIKMNIDIYGTILTSYLTDIIFFVSESGRIYKDDLYMITIDKNKVQSFFIYSEKLYIIYENNTIQKITSNLISDNENIISNIPIKVKGNIIKIARNLSLHFILTTNGVYAYGENDFNLLSNVNEKNEIEFFRDKKIIDIIFTNTTIYARSSNGIVYEYGKGFNDSDEIKKHYPTIVYSSS